MGRSPSTANKKSKRGRIAVPAFYSTVGFILSICLQSTCSYVHRKLVLSYTTRPTGMPTVIPTGVPTAMPTVMPTGAPTVTPIAGTAAQTMVPTPTTTVAQVGASPVQEEAGAGIEAEAEAGAEEEAGAGAEEADGSAVAEEGDGAGAGDGDNADADAADNPDEEEATDNAAGDADGRRQLQVEEVTAQPTQASAASPSLPSVPSNTTAITSTAAPTPASSQGIAQGIAPPPASATTSAPATVVPTPPSSSATPSPTVLVEYITRKYSHSIGLWKWEQDRGDGTGKACYPYSLCIDSRVCLAPKFDTAFNTARTFALMSSLLAGVVTIIIVVALFVPFNVTYLTPVYVTLMLFQGLSLTIFRSDLCNRLGDVTFWLSGGGNDIDGETGQLTQEAEAFSRYMTRETVVTCSNDAGSNMAISAVVMWFLAAITCYWNVKKTTRDM